MLKEWNSTFLTLVPKSQKAHSFQDYRPISLTNVCYKVVCKILANRLKPLLPNLISPNQTGFMEGRWINENGVLTQEMMHFMNKTKARRGWVGIKVDFAKAFDSMEWHFILQILRNFGFHDRFIHWISQCLTTPSFSILLNGSPHGFFKISRGLRQGDPISPYLFILGIEVFSRMMNKAENLNQLKGVKIARRGPQINHLLFADDLFIFTRATNNDVSCCKTILDKFCMWSGQSVNTSKSGLIFSKNIRPSTRNSIKYLLGMRKLATNSKYLGNPLRIGKKKSKSFEFLLEKIKEKLAAWKCKTLSLAGRTTLVRSVLNSIPLYTMSLFKLPKQICNKIDSYTRRFWWGCSENKNKNKNVFLLQRVGTIYANPNLVEDWVLGKHKIVIKPCFPRLLGS